MVDTRPTHRTAEAFFTAWTAPEPNRLAALLAEQPVSGDIDAVVQEARASNYWNRQVAARRRRQAAEHRRAAIRIIQDAANTPKRVEGNRLPAPNPIPGMPAFRTLQRTDQQRAKDRAEAHAWWARLTKRRLGSPAARRAILTAHQVEDARSPETRHALEQARHSPDALRAQAAIQRAALADRRRRDQPRYRGFQPAGMSQERALEIAIAVLAHTQRPPQDR